MAATMGETEYILDDRTGEIVYLTPERRAYLEATADTGYKTVKEVAKAAGIAELTVYNAQRDGALLDYVRQKAFKHDLTIDNIIITIRDAMKANIARGKPDHKTRLRAANMAGNLLGFLGSIAVKQVQLQSEVLEEGDEQTGVVTVEEVRKMKGGTEEIIQRMTQRKTIVLQGEVTEDADGRRVLSARTKRRRG